MSFHFDQLYSLIYQRRLERFDVLEHLGVCVYVHICRILICTWQKCYSQTGDVHFCPQECQAWSDDGVPAGVSHAKSRGYSMENLDRP